VHGVRQSERLVQRMGVARPAVLQRAVLQRSNVVEQRNHAPTQPPPTSPHACCPCRRELPLRAGTRLCALNSPPRSPSTALLCWAAAAAATAATAATAAAWLSDCPIPTSRPPPIIFTAQHHHHPPPRRAHACPPARPSPCARVALPEDMPAPASCALCSSTS
jgi:hypothetical protein